jgi:hypothetical protein
MKVQRVTRNSDRNEVVDQNTACRDNSNLTPLVTERHEDRLET